LNDRQEYTEYTEYNGLYTTTRYIKYR